MALEQICPGCRSRITPGQPYCPNCGHELTPVWASGAMPHIGKQSAGTGQPAGPESGQNQPVPSPTPSDSQTSPGAPANSAHLVKQGGTSRPWPFSADILAERLVVGGYMQRPVVDALKSEAQTTDRSIVDLILQHKQLSPEALRDAMSRIFGLPVVDLRAVQIDPDLISNFPSELARIHRLLPLHRDNDRLVMVVDDPTQAEAIRSVRRTVGLTVDLRLAAQQDLVPAIERFFAARIVALLPSGETLDIVLGSGEIKIGRSDINDVILPDPTVGSTHAILRHQGSEYHIVDFGSRNGVFVDGKKIDQSQVLKNGNVIAIGQCLLTFKLPIPEAAKAHDGATQILSPTAVASLIPGAQAAARTGSVPVLPYPAGVPSTDDEGKKKKKKKKDKDKKEGGEKLKSAWIGFASRIIAQIVGAVATIILGLAVAGKLPTSCYTIGESRSHLTPPEGVALIASVPFSEKNGDIEFNASGVVQVSDSTFLFCDNNTSDALFEFTVDAQGNLVGPIKRRPLVGMQAGQVDDIEALTMAEVNGKRYLFATTSLQKKVNKKKGEFGLPPSGLIRIVEDEAGSLRAEVIPDFRDWFLAQVADLPAGASLLEPDEGGINVEGLAWNASTNSLLFGLRTPVLDGKPVVVSIKVDDIAGPWTVDRLSFDSIVRLGIESAGAEQGIRAIEYEPDRGAYLVIVGNATSGSDAPFSLYLWDGNTNGVVSRKTSIWFEPKTKPEGISKATIGGTGGSIIVDDSGGVIVLWDSDSRWNS